MTWRTHDSIPATVLKRWLDERDQWLKAHRINSAAPTWKDEVARLPVPERTTIMNRVAERWESALDACHGECLLRRPEIGQVVANSLKFFDGDRYRLTDFVVMPNHVHVLAAFENEEAMLIQCESWKHYTATQINRLVGRRGRFWETDGFDHLVRSAEQFDYLRRYIAENPNKAKLQAGEYLLYSKEL